MAPWEEEDYATLLHRPCDLLANESSKSFDNTVQLLQEKVGLPNVHITQAEQSPEEIVNYILVGLFLPRLSCVLI